MLVQERDGAARLLVDARSGEDRRDHFSDASGLNLRAFAVRVGERAAPAAV